MQSSRLTRGLSRSLPRALNRQRLRVSVVLCRPVGAAVTPQCNLQATQHKEAVLCKHIKAHEASLTAALVLKDDGSDCKQIITASLDKTLAHWTVHGCQEELGEALQVEVTRLSPPGAPVFSVIEAVPAGPEIPALSGRPAEQSVYLGMAAKEIISWHPRKGELSDKVRMNGHTGWVRSMATMNKWLFSCGCNYLRQWDTSYAVPKEVSSTKLFTGDILGIAAGGGKVFSCGADGSIRSWRIAKNGDMVDSVARDKAHDARVTNLLWHKDLLYSVSYDGSLKAWDPESLELVMCVKGAHAGERIYTSTMGPDGTLYTGGDDKLVRRWNPLLLQSDQPPLELHAASVRVLAVGSKETLVSGDSNGELAVWIV